MRSERVDSRLTGESGNAQVEQLRRRLAALWVAVVALAVVLSAGAGYGYLALEKHQIALADLPGMKETLAAASQRLEGLEGKLAAWASASARFEERLEKLARKVAYNRELARTDAEKLAAGVEERLKAEMAEQAGATEARLSLLESAQAAEQARLSQLQEEVAAVRLDAGRDLGNLNQHLAENDRRVAALARRLEPERVDFELAEDQTQELAPGISLRITRTSVSHQRASGWLWLLPDRKTLWVRELGIQQPLVFYRKDGSGPTELVITTVGKGSVAGYLLLPAPQELGEAAKAPAAGAAEADAPVGQ